MNENEITTPVPALEFEWDENNMVMRGLTCVDHPSTRWLTKHLWDRNLFYVGIDTPECDCDISRLVVTD